ncbi:argininosuccinate lyase [Streptococcus pasteurianus]|nr:argininosuccinate lyase [Streptococcus pasteurianus]
MPFERYQEISDLIDEDIYETLKSHTAVERRHSLGGTGFDQVKWQIKEAKNSLKATH